MTIEIYQKPINLYSFSIRGREDERQAIIEIQSQILKWIRTNNMERDIRTNRSNSILINKLVYYIASEIQKKNRKMIISRGWYKYGPCYDLGRQSEESLTLILFDHLIPSERIIPEVERNCEIEIPLFLKSVKGREYPYEYLKHIYNERADFTEIQNFYIVKHELAYQADVCKRNSSIENIKKLNELSIRFDREITNSEYLNAVRINTMDIDTILEFTAIMNQILNDYGESKGEKYQSLATKIVDDFINIVLMAFANKNYAYTFQTANERNKIRVTEITSKFYDGYIDKIKKLLEDYYRNLDM